ncbi:hypothetical protein QQ045_003488 [Rhodiola kirilowii]
MVVQGGKNKELEAITIETMWDIRTNGRTIETRQVSAILIDTIRMMVMCTYSRNMIMALWDTMMGEEEDTRASNTTRRTTKMHGDTLQFMKARRRTWVKPPMKSHQVPPCQKRAFKRGENSRTPQGDVRHDAGVSGRSKDKRRRGKSLRSTEVRKP